MAGKLKAAVVFCVRFIFQQLARLIERFVVPIMIGATVVSVASCLFISIALFTGVEMSWLAVVGAPVYAAASGAFCGSAATMLSTMKARNLTFRQIVGSKEEMRGWAERAFRSELWSVSATFLTVYAAMWIAGLYKELYPGASAALFGLAVIVSQAVLGTIRYLVGVWLSTPPALDPAVQIDRLCDQVENGAIELSNEMREAALRMYALLDEHGKPHSYSDGGSA